VEVGRAHFFTEQKRYIILDVESQFLFFLTTITKTKTRELEFFQSLEEADDSMSYCFVVGDYLLQNVLQHSAGLHGRLGNNHESPNP